MARSESWQLPIPEILGKTRDRRRTANRALGIARVQTAGFGMVLPDRRHDQRESSESAESSARSFAACSQCIESGRRRRKGHLVVAKINSAGGEGMTNDECRVPREIRSSKSEIRNKFLLNSTVSSSFLMSWP